MTDTTSITSKAAPQRLTLLPGQQLHTRPREWLRATCGAAIGLFVSVWVCQLVFGAAVATLLIGPVGASAILLFSVPSGALAQPWSIFGGYLVSATVATLVAQLGGHSLEMAALAVALSLIAMFALRCLHPPGGAVALCVVLAGPALQALDEKAVLPVMLNALTLLAIALFYNNLTGVRYPKRPLPEINLQHTSDQPALQRVGFSDADLDAALADIGGFVDLTREDLTQLVRKVEDAARRRSMGTAQVADIMSRDLRCATPETRVREALDLLHAHRLRVLPVLDAEQALVGIVSLTDLANFVGRSGSFRLLRRGGGEKSPLSEVMTSPVIAVAPELPVSELIPMLSSQGLHCLPVVEQNRLVGMVTQTDLIAALQENLLMRG